jgi:WD40 repeat protein
LKGHSNVVLGLGFSPNGKKLISGSGDFDAIIWDVEEAKLLHRLKGHRDDIYAVGFTPDGQRAVTGSQDNTLRLWTVADGALLREMTGHRYKLRSLAVSPKDGSIASGDRSGEIRLWDGLTGALKKVLANHGGPPGSLHFSPDGGVLLSTCGYSGCDDTQRIYDAASGKELIAYAKHDSIVLASAFLADGDLVATGGGEQFPVQVWDPKTGETKAVLKGTGRPGWAVGFSADGRGIAWGNTSGYQEHNIRGPLETALRLPGADVVLAEPEPVANQEGWVRAKASFDALSLQARKGGAYGFDAILDLFKDGKPTGISIERGSTDGYQHRSYSFTPDGQQIVSGGSNGWLTAYGLDGKNLGNFVGHESEVWAAVPSPDGRYLVSGSADQTVRLWNLQSRELIVTLFRGEDGAWVMWTPQGFYASSPGGDSLVGWQINHGPDKPAEYITGAHFEKN